ncbi:MAG: hypothetical protein HYT64_00500 [Candidatus Yanofskybacteria bacterium]|nr:hypothetical protein [Candidatus Yanofskybacteria bacterium]
MDKYTLLALNDVINSYYDDEHKHWQESGEPKRGHIFNDIELIADWVDKEMKRQELI